MNPLTGALTKPERLDKLNGRQWDELLTLARYTRLTGRLYTLVVQRGVLETIPPVATDVLIGASIYTDHMQLLVRRELLALNSVLADVDFPVVLLKGAAYLLSGLPAAEGRRMNDIDILVPQANLAEMEERLECAGWGFDETLSAYDNHYYREWSHELPPMRHPNSPIELDVHHNLIQTTGRIKLDASLLFVDLVPVEGTVFTTLSPLDMVLHSATHLFMSDELRGGLRDLVDMHTLSAYFSAQDEQYWQKLAERASELGLQRPLYYAAAAMRRNLHTSIPESAWRTIESGRPPRSVDRIMQRAIDRHIAPENITRLRSPVTEHLLYLRSHWIRMPPLMLARHLVYKWWVGIKGE
ncbi:nucleotidyltransferase family protein [Seongchinamella sediminis]|uniref:nucleotidyltransferase domain-containing protein n=1 Tax=Seongchinamella sediminis TaxID=2283635 RepID=UPI0013C2F0A7|nr:nucleotidyltransferase family protein [Seongchinamella sediminis]